MIRCNIYVKNGYGFSSLAICAVRTGLDMGMGKQMVCGCRYGYGSRDNLHGLIGENKGLDMDMDMGMDMVVKF
jgi:hypothetical protein